jgi:hypothetical protein
MDITADLRDLPGVISIERDSDIDVRNYVEVGDQVGNEPTLNCVNTAEDDVTASDSAYCSGSRQARRKSFDDRAQANSLNGSSGHFYLRSALCGVGSGRIQDAIEIEIFYYIVIDYHESADAKSHELLDHNATRAGTANDRRRDPS